jgi:hypothetical protein
MTAAVCLCPCCGQRNAAVPGARCASCGSLLTSASMIPDDSDGFLPEDPGAARRICPCCRSAWPADRMSCPQDRTSLAGVPLRWPHELPVERIVVLRDAGTGVEIHLASRDEVVGRAQAGRSVLADDLYCSRAHLRVLNQTDACRILCLSGNGVRIDGRSAVGWTALLPGNRLRIGRTEFQVSYVQRKAPSP